MVRISRYYFLPEHLSFSIPNSAENWHILHSPNSPIIRTISSLLLTRWRSLNCVSLKITLTVHIKNLINLIQRTSSSWPSSTRRHCPHSISHRRIVLSELPDTTNLDSRYIQYSLLYYPQWQWRNEWRIEGMKEWRIEGMKEWRIEGMKEWRNEGTKERRNEGLKEWRNEGMKNEGLKEWRNEGIKEWRNDGI